MNTPPPINSLNLPPPNWLSIKFFLPCLDFPGVLPVDFTGVLGPALPVDVTGGCPGVIGGTLVVLLND